MQKVIKGALIGGAVGGGVAAIQSSTGPVDPSTTEPLRPKVVKGALQGAVAGAVVGWVLERRARRALAAAPLDLGRRAARLAERARPVLSNVVDELSDLEETLRPVVASAAGRAADAVSDVVDQATPPVKRIAERAADAARPAAEAARERASEVAAGAADVARERAADVAEAARERATEVAEVARTRVSDATVRLSPGAIDPAALRELALDRAEIMQQRLSRPEGEPRLILVRR
jgi:hypothetical protein